MPYPSEKTKLKDMIDWAKDRLLDDQFSSLEADSAGYLGFNPVRQKALQHRVSRFARLLALPITLESLQKLRKANFWNGGTDTFWEHTEKPNWYKGQ